MKRFIAFLLSFMLLFGIASAESPATPTDLVVEEPEEELYIFDDDDHGIIVRALVERKVYLDLLQIPEHYDDKITLIAILVDFLEDDIYYFQWEESADGQNWHIIPGEVDRTYTFTLNSININYCWRVKVILEE